MSHTSRHWRLFYLALSAALVVIPAESQTAALSTISDTVYRADGNPASGVLLIAWPPFTTANGVPVAAGNKSVTLGMNGSMTVQLTPNSGATPAGTLYTVVYQLTDATVKIEYWSVGTNSPQTIAAVRTAAGVTTSGSQFATQQYVNAQLANVVHLGGTETITGAKQFTVPPVLPTPSQSGQAVNKAYVDASVANVGGGGNFVSKSGDTMTGPLTLPGDPAAPNQAANKHYVDVGFASKADLVGGLVPTGELGSGTANSVSCLHGDSSWGGCGTGGGGPGLTPGMLAIKYATDFAWTQNPAADLSTAGAKTVTLTACPPGVSGTEAQYYVYISGTGTAEPVLVTGGTCTGNGLPGTLQFTTANSHPAGYVVGSASSGLQEALIAARFTPSNPARSSQSGKVIVPSGELKAYARISVRASNVTVDFSGSIVECWMNDTCIFVGDGVTSRFHLSQTPFTKSNKTIFNEEYITAALDPTRWSAIDPTNSMSLKSGKLQVAGGNGNDGATVVKFVEKVELASASVLQHGDIVFNSASNGILGGLYLGAVSAVTCIAGFQIAPAGSNSQIQSFINGASAGAPLTTIAGHHYILTTRFYS
jgi:hypothetical protein